MKEKEPIVEPLTSHGNVRVGGYPFMSRLSKKRFFSVQALKSKDQVIVLDPSESHHLSQVLRIESHESFRVFDDKGNEWQAQIDRIDSHGNASIRLFEKMTDPVKSTFRLTVAQAIPQRAKMDVIAEKAAELGVDVLIPMVTERTVVQIKKDQQSKVIARWERIVREAMKQSRSRIQTEIASIQRFESILTSAQSQSIILPDPSGQVTLSELVCRFRDVAAKSKFDLLVLIGPEGGFSEKEIVLARDKRVDVISLGSNILKTDTAFVTIAGFLKLSLG